ALRDRARAHRAAGAGAGAHLRGPHLLLRPHLRRGEEDRLARRVRGLLAHRARERLRAAGAALPPRGRGTRHRPAPLLAARRLSRVPGGDGVTSVAEAPALRPGVEPAPPSPAAAEPGGLAARARDRAALPVVWAASGALMLAYLRRGWVPHDEGA